MDESDSSSNLSSAQTCSTCGAAASANTELSFVYAIGRIEPQFPNLSVEKEFIQVTGRAETAGLTDRETLHRVLGEAQNRYLARQLCWVMTISGVETYILRPPDGDGLTLLIESVRPRPKPADLDVVIGLRGPLAPPSHCAGLALPVVVFDQIYSFDRESLFKAIPQPKKAPVKDIGAASEELFDRVLQISNNKGATDEHRALNYLLVRYPPIYANVADAFHRNASLSAIEARVSPLSGARKIVDVILSYADRATDFREKYAVRVDVTGRFPFPIAGLSHYIDR